MSNPNFEKQVSDSFIESFKREPEVIAAAPGRLEVLGNHTDYNDGYVLSTATDLRTYFAVSKSNSKVCRLKSINNNWDAEFDINDLEKPKAGCWSNYIKGVVYELSKIDKSRIFPFDAAILSTIPLSAGMSSSAALEVSVGFGLGKLFGFEMSKEAWAKLGQRVENHYMGLQSGLLDQFSSIFGEQNRLIMSDFREVKVMQKVDIPEDYSFVVANTMVKHNLVDSDYNERRENCESSVAVIQKKYPEIKALRDVDFKMLNSCRDDLSVTQYKRALHVVGENYRVLKGVEFLKTGNIEGFGKLMFESHQSSIDNFENSCPELDYYIELAKTIPGCVGARLSGGGFGGISIHLVKKNMAELYSKRLLAAFRIQTKIEDASAIVCQAGRGAWLVK